MLTLCGSPVSNYYNKVKLALLEKGAPFAEEYVYTHSTDPAVINASPLAKIPFIRTGDGALCESQVILDYVEATWPQPALLPADAFAAAKVRELTTFIDWHLEITARQLYGQAFFGGAALPESSQVRIRKQLENHIAAFRKLAKFSPYVAGDEFTQADCSAYASLPLVGMASKVVFGEDLLVAGGVDYKPYLKLIGERPSAQKVVADRKAAQTKA
ncbi:MAG TPA: glutathione S-transferase [Polaromonas sp.]|uniref:glutathione S-transferase family protein n=1 Tax=Polaromonas sp. TaxID=1869339 RepID=UPI002D6F3539|nr:glutathione S-transferase [Polaromonas sp.]HYW58771.1 glutathione S-transferase [Polaromonas sp.]